MFTYARTEHVTRICTHSGPSPVRRRAASPPPPPPPYPVRRSMACLLLLLLLRLRHHPSRPTRQRGKTRRGLCFARACMHACVRARRGAAESFLPFFSSFISVFPAYFVRACVTRDGLISFSSPSPSLPRSSLLPAARPRARGGMPAEGRRLVFSLLISRCCSGDWQLVHAILWHCIYLPPSGAPGDRIGSGGKEVVDGRNKSTYYGDRRGEGGVKLQNLDTERGCAWTRGARRCDDVM